MTRRAAVIGHPIQHSVSPAMHQAAIAATGLAARYDALEVAPAVLPGLMAVIRQPEWFGVNVTVPHKEAVLGFLDELTPEARRIGAVNTIKQHRGRLIGHNTDAAGFLRALSDDAAFDPRGARCLIVGAGGAARACVVALANAGAARIAVVNRNLDRARRLAAEFASLGAVEPYEPNGDPCPDFDLLVNATTLGMVGGPDASAIAAPIEWLRPGTLVYDLVYRPTETPLIVAARRTGARPLGGLAMLVYQGAAAFEWWTGLPAPIAAMREAAVAALEEKTSCSVS
ncbi:MAG: shikimate dehydrogenase [Dehalococcoidia bacterium]|nr:shikimate dehydrogenase [Dehalococcoidia bacterium]